MGYSQPVYITQFPSYKHEFHIQLNLLPHMFSIPRETKGIFQQKYILLKCDLIELNKLGRI